MDKFSGLFIKSNGEWQVHGELNSDTEGQVKALRQITDALGKVKLGKTEVTAEAAAVIHSTKGVVQSRKF